MARLRPAAPPPSITAVRASEKLLAAAREAGAAEERKRIAAIMGHQHARGRLAFAWALASTGTVTLELAEQALQIHVLTSAFAETEQAGQPLFSN